MSQRDAHQVKANCGRDQLQSLHMFRELDKAKIVRNTILYRSGIDSFIRGTSFAKVNAMEASVPSGKRLLRMILSV